MFKFKQVSPLLALIASVTVSTSAMATAAVPSNTVNLMDGANNTLVSGIQQMDESASGRGLVVGGATVPTLNSSFHFLYQSNVAGLNAANTAAIPTPGLNSAFELTLVADVVLKVTSITTIGNGYSATFAAQSGTASLYYDDFTSGAQSAVSSGAGFSDGVKVGTFSLVAGSGFSTFYLFNPTSGSGATNFSFTTVGTVDSGYLSANSGYSITGLNFSSSQSLLGLNDVASASVNGATVTSADLQLAIDGNNTFVTTPVPEPSTYAMLIAGIGMVGMIVRRRQRRD